MNYDDGAGKVYGLNSQLLNGGAFEIVIFISPLGLISHLSVCLTPEPPI